MRKIAQILIFCIPIILFGSVVFMAGCGHQEMANEEKNKAMVHRFLDEFWNKGNLAVLDEIAAPNFVHQLNAESRSLEAYKKLYADFPVAYPESHYTLKDMIVEGENVVIFWTWRGTVAKTGKQVTDFPGITIFYFADGKVEKILSCHDMTPFH